MTDATALPGAEDVAELLEFARSDSPWGYLKGSEIRDIKDLIERVCLSIPRASDEVPANPVGEGLALDAARFRALMRTPRFRMFGAAGVDRETGERTGDAGWLHFGCEVWSRYPGFDPDEPDSGTVWGRHALRALADAILEEEAKEALKSAPTASSQEQGASGEVAK